MKIKKTILIAAVACLSSYSSVMGTEESISTTYSSTLMQSELSCFLSNTAELPFDNNIINTSLYYSKNQKDLGSSLMLHIKDFGIGDFAISADLIAENTYMRSLFQQGAVDSETSALLSTGVGNGKLSWAKRSGLLSVGAAASYYRFQEFNSINQEQQGLN